MSKRTLLVLTLALFALNALVWVFVFHRDKTLTVSFLDVGQGDAILIESPGGIDMLVDGGRDRSVLRELGRELGPLDRSIDIVVATHPDADHIGGLSGVFGNYRVGTFISSHIANDTSATEALDASVYAEKGVKDILARRGERIYLGGGAYVDVLFPDRSVTNVETNTGSVVLRVVYGETSFILTGDSPSSIEDWLVALDAGALKSTVLKAGHHGSRTSTDALWLSEVNPDTVVISAGKGNSYGHPHEETLERIQASGAETLSTMGSGAVRFVSDGTTVKRK